MKRIIAIVLIGVMVLAQGCTKELSIRAQKLSEDNVGNKTDTVELKEEFINAASDFAAEFLKKSSDGDGNVLVSPVSVMLALGMTANGADGATLDEFEDVLGSGLTIEDINKYYFSYCESLPDTEKCRMSIANSIWINDTESFEADLEFLDKNTKYYNADIYKTVFDSRAVKDVNNWVEAKTGGMIDKIINELSEEDIMVLINAISFDGEWESVYEDNQVHDTYFTDAGGKEQKAEGMYCSVSTYLEDENTTGFVKKYKDGYSFVALLPDEDVSIDEYIEGFTGEKYLNLINNSTECEVNTMIPKFTYDFQLEADDALKAMGLQSAFDRAGADFSKMGEYDGGGLYIGAVIHKTHIEMAEKGTKAGAATAVIMCGNSMLPMETKTVYLDRPFVYAIVDNQTNIPVFVGALKTME